MKLNHNFKKKRLLNALRLLKYFNNLIKLNQEIMSDPIRNFNELKTYERIWNQAYKLKSNYHVFLFLN